MSPPVGYVLWRMPGLRLSPLCKYRKNCGTGERNSRFSSPLSDHKIKQADENDAYARLGRPFNPDRLAVAYGVCQGAVRKMCGTTARILSVACHTSFCYDAHRQIIEVCRSHASPSCRVIVALTGKNEFRHGKSGDPVRNVRRSSAESPEIQSKSQWNPIQKSMRSDPESTEIRTARS